LANLGAAGLWDDEAVSAIVARNLAHTGYLIGWDGRNLLAYRNGALLDNNLRYTECPLTVWLMALSFKLFGYNEWAARFPSALCGIACLPIFLAIVRRRLPDRPAVALYCLAFCSLSVQCILFD
jgi:4-amino-4-deoxy-L-arabinose transferase-like glycosyltransferase